ncbi:hypothetical protein [Arcobacter sp. YIC-80]|uniref:hypothetical protein n=1 Tax=unclassified Arcobacter TaxID=2593671 RepID=UPI00384EDC75
MKSNFEEPKIMTHHLVSGAAVSLLAAGTINAMRIKKGETNIKKATYDVVKRTTQGTIATASVVAASSYKNEKNGMFKALASLAVGAAGVYAVEMIDKKFNSDEQVEAVSCAKENNEVVEYE